LALVASLIKATSEGPVFYRQTRLGQHGREFTMLKFRTMHRNADKMLDKVFHLNEANGPLFKVKNDPRITPVGKLLRRSYLDELPQLVNVLRGELSLVGPRPCLPVEAATMDGQISFRFSVPQGLTGPWQANGRHSLTFEEQISLERDYIDNWSIRRDLTLLARTIPVVFSCGGL
jgi:lipopolysaccharide/colanic/teichoic acid biosynthesis glycosyltransferase